MWPKILNVFRTCSLKWRVCVGLVVLLLFISYYWIHICHIPQTVGAADFVCGHHIVNIKDHQGYTPVGILVEAYNNRSMDKQKIKSIDKKIHMTFQNALSLYADSKRVILLSVMDTGCLDMTINLYLSSYKRLNITNYVFLSSDDRACPEMLNKFPDIHCIHYADDQDWNSASSFGTKAFIRKTYLKSKAVQEALLQDYNVLLMDIDIVLFKDPFPYFEKCSGCDLQIQWDHQSVCSGFYYIRSTNGGPLDICIENKGKLFMEKVWKIAQTGSQKRREQISFQIAVNELKGNKGFKHIVLPEKDFPNGHAYFHVKKIMFATDGEFPPRSYLVHDNWIISQAAKIYRFKETSMWYYDKNGYYSNPSEKYIMYQDRFPKSRNTTDLETQALKAALLMGYLLKRIVILPSFSCHTCNTVKFGACKVKSQECAFLTTFKVEQFDKFFDGLYREHMFLQNDMVPLTVKQSRSKVLVSDADNNVKGGDPKDITVFPLKTFESITDVTNWFSKYDNTSVLVMDQIQTGWYSLSKRFLDDKMDRKLKSAFKHTTYLQN